MALPTSPGDPGIVCVWHASIRHVFSRDSGAVARALPLLRPAERERFDRFRQDADRQMFLLGRVMARTLVGNALGVAPHDWPWREGTRGRPEIDDVDCPISFNLAHSKYHVAKYLPYGPVKDVIPYLMRRAQENTSVAGQTGRELGLISKEKARRKL